jgi:structural maintenance of chromosome 3 (chondroitin sulfate proteoglycan 6)
VQQEKVAQRIKTTEQKLSEMIIEFNDKKDKEKNILKEHDDKIQRRDQLYGKQARGNQFKSVVERNKALDKEINENKKRNDKNNRTLTKTEDDSDKLENKFANLKSDLPRKQTDFLLLVFRIIDLFVVFYHHVLLKCSFLYLFYH